MATFLYRLGRLAFRRRRLFLMLWIAVLATVGIGAASVSGTTTDDFTLPGTQSQKAIDLLEKEFPKGSADGAAARVVFEAPDGRKMTSGAHKTEIESLVADLRVRRGVGTARLNSSRLGSRSCRWPASLTHSSQQALTPVDDTDNGAFEVRRNGERTQPQASVAGRPWRGGRIYGARRDRRCCPGHGGGTGRRAGRGGRGSHRQ
ncbi:MMPL family transporter [Streptomyces sp. FXJ1.4098]|nr:MMPL family transporter [Streptomyces sp. FXJ1.4098]